MSEDQPRIPDVTIETLCRTFFREAARYGFRQVDYIRFVNLLLDLAMSIDAGVARTVEERPDDDEPAPKTPLGSALSLPLEGARINVRAFDADTDLDLIEGWLHDDHGRYFLLSRTIASELTIHEVMNQTTSLIGIVTLKDGQAIGSVAYLDYDAVQRKAELRKLIGDPELRGKGYAKEASQLWLDYGLNGLGLKKIYLNTLNTNLRNLRLNEELGFKIEGILRNEVYFDGSYHDVLRMGLWQG